MAQKGLTQAVDKLRSFRLPADTGIPVGAAVAFSLATALTNLSGTGVQRIPGIGVFLSRAPILPAIAVAYLVKIKAISNFIGPKSADLLSLAAIYAGIEQQTQLSARIVNFTSNIGKKALPAPVQATAATNFALGQVRNPLLQGLSPVEQAFVMNT